MILLPLVAFAFAWSMGAHYTGACMGMPYATGSIRLRPALALMAAMTFVGALLFSHRVLVHVGHGIVGGGLGAGAATAVIGVAFLLTTIFTQLRIPTSTIQILVFCLIGAAARLGLAVNWHAVLGLAALWVAAPAIACGLGYALTRGLDLVPALREGGGLKLVARGLVAVGAAASLAMGANDVSNATAVFLAVHLTGPLLAGGLGGLGLALGVLTWGRPLLERVAFDVVRMDRTMATAAQLAQACVVLAAVGFGDFTSMNQALIGAMAGAGLARGRQTIQARTIAGILRGWAIGPAAGFLATYLAVWLLGGG
ncbi:MULTISPECIES: inorganic phosphate transporter [Acidiphilium]|nr:MULTISPECIES: inorganic phosphate transporter [Acidiphilium]MBS3022349.1 inorganic phosphate transporter [Acidiphilium multivorum]MBU6357375.1 inorganic phosphate transporter family protein [Rhodospirillales bacterium]UNC12758.1 inorganic phosphate transporter [Acidiphilium multivorum]